MRLGLLCCLVLLSLAALADPQDIHVGSQAALWGQRTPVQKVAFLEGMCEGLAGQGRSKLSDLSCGSSFTAGGGTRFCFLVHSDSPTRAVAYVDRFYSERTQTEVPLWAVVAAYNDKSCKEDTITSKLPQMQKRNECIRQAANMLASPGVSSAARQAQEAHCEALKF